MVLTSLAWDSYQCLGRAHLLKLVSYLSYEDTRLKKKKTKQHNFVLDHAKIFKYIWLGSWEPREKGDFVSPCSLFLATLKTCVV